MVQVGAAGDAVDAENGGFINTTVGRTPRSRSAIASASNAVTATPGKSRVSARVGAYSLRWSAPAARSSSAHCAITASMPADGSSTVSSGRTAAACNAA